MSSFLCPECGERIIEDRNGWFITGCEHFRMYDVDMIRQRNLEDLFKKEGNKDD